MIRRPKESRSHMWRTTVDVFAIVGVFFAAVSAITSVIGVLPDAWKKGTFVERSQLQLANAVAPQGYSVSHETVSVVGRNSTFWLNTGQGVLLERTNGQDTIALAEFPGGMNPHPGFIPIYVNGVSHDLQIGEQVKTSETGCFVWPVARTTFFRNFTHEGEWEFEYHCNK